MMNGWRCLTMGLVMVAGLGCGAEPVADPCEDPPTFTNQILPLSEEKCVTCHSRDLDGDARKGAPSGLDFDDWPAVEPNREAFADAITSGREPPSTAIPPIATTKAERELVSLWRRCGFPR